MASRLNLLFSAAPQQFLERTVLFCDRLTSEESLSVMRNKLTHFIDFEPLQLSANARVLAGLHEYQDTPLASYFVPPAGTLLLPKNNSPHRFVFMPEFSSARLLVATDGELLKLSVEQNLSGVMPAPEKSAGSRYVDSFAYWDHIGNDLVGRVRGTAVLVKDSDEPWTVYMQLIIGIPGHEQVRRLFYRPLNY